MSQSINTHMCLYAHECVIVQEWILNKVRRETRWMKRSQDLLAQPFIPFQTHRRPTPRESTRTRSVVSHRQEKANDRERQHAYRSYYGYDSDVGGGMSGGGDGSQALEELLVQSRSRAKALLDQHCASLRQQVWLEMEAVFRQLWEHGKQFFEQLEASIATGSQHLTNTQANSYRAIRQRLVGREGHSFLDISQVEVIGKRVVEGVRKLLEDQLLRCVGSLFVLHDCAGGEWGRMEGDSEGLRDRAGSCHSDKMVPLSDSRCSQVGQFGLLFNRIRQKQSNLIARRISNLNSKKNGVPLNPYFEYLQSECDNPYQLGEQEDSVGSMQVSRHSTMRIQDRRESSANRRIEGSKNSRKRSNNVAISPVISRGQRQHEHTSDYRSGHGDVGVEYRVSADQQSVVSEWCEEVKVDPRTIVVGEAVGDSALCVAMCRGDVAVGCTSSIIRVYHVQQPSSSSLSSSQASGWCGGARVSELVGHSAPVCCLYWDLQWLYSGGDVGCGSILIWDPRGWTVRTKLSYHSGAVTSIMVVPSTNFLLSSSLDKTIKIFDCDSCTIVGSHNSAYPCSRLLYYENAHLVAALTPAPHIDIVGVDVGQGAVLGKTGEIACGGGVVCGGKSTTATDHDILAVGLQDGTIEAYTLPARALVRRVCTDMGPISSIICFGRYNKHGLPLLLYCGGGSRALHLLNLETLQTKTMDIRGGIDFTVTCGINPVMVVGARGELVWPSHRDTNCRINIANFRIL